MDNAAPRIAVPIRTELIVGVTSHRDLDPAQLPTLRAQVRDALETLRTRYPELPLVILSALAEGGDRLVARARAETRPQAGAETAPGQAENDPEADIARHFEYGGKIKRVYVNEAQLKALNAGELGVVQLDGRYVLVDAATLAHAETLFAPAIALKVDPNADAKDDPYADPKYQVPDDLVW